MAENSFSLHILLAFALSFHLQFAISDHFTTTVFDVGASIQRTLDVLSFDPQNSKPNLELQKLDAQPSSSSSSSSHSSFSLSLHPRSSLQKTRHKDYKQLTLARLARDSARVDSLGAKLELAINGIRRSELKPVGTNSTSFEPEKLQTPVTSGKSQGSGEYFSRIGVGRPAKPYYMVIDTGSDVSWIQCKPCFSCYQQTDPIFDPSASSTYRAMSCESSQCEALQVSACRSDSCVYQVSYGDGSFTVGDFATETLSFGSSGSVNNVAIGCGRDNEGLFAAAAGLLGLGGGVLSLPSQFKATSFSYCLVDRDSAGSSTLEFNSARPGDSVTAPMLRNSKYKTFFYVGLIGMSVGGNPVAISPSVFAVDASGRGGVIVDSGTAVTRLTTEAYNAVRNMFVRMTPNLPKASGYAIFDTCYDLSSFRQVAIPTVSFRFSGGKTMTLKASNYMIPVDSSGKVCLAFAPTDGPLSIIGNIQQQGTRVSFDIANSVVGFSPNKC
ncbi:Protein ASPARTIC PROTEASE IN GUARD CELL 1 like [Actinidia chinensis var. chinensis]|uniref:Protein ASPARTIC PROTEASE IN GUARD CELL 1 like n=1 Tax=Actinidia chinensis var. chinensis TaxID=1590841 RepID=A0A2R6PDH6_ACTCC|nr:Protein ASPARTIC PROTEASE IN GUARD CELL 1 like [Actinidia chinensis var. chinensis]